MAIPKNVPNPSQRGSNDGGDNVLPNLGGQATPGNRRVVDPVVNPFDDDDETFTQLPPSQVSSFDEEEDPYLKPSNESQREHNSLRRSTRNPDWESVEEEAPTYKPVPVKETPALPRGYTEDTFIDTKNHKLRPFGRGRKAKVGEFDHRHNLRQRSKFIQWGVLAMLGILILLGMKNALIPPSTLSEEEVTNIVAANATDHGYPLERGKGFATDFMKAFLSVNSDPNAPVMLNYFYTGSTTGGAGGGQGNNAAPSTDFKQTLLSGPTVYDVKAISANSASYVFGALVQPESAKNPAPTDGSAAKMSFFNVNVYYNAKKDSFIISPDSPTIIPLTSSESQSGLPAAAKLGVGPAPENVTTDVQSVVYGFIKGYAATSPLDHSGIDQYIAPNPSPALLKGLNNRYVLSADPSSSIKYGIFSTEDPTVFKAQVTVTWRDKVDTLIGIDYNSTYVMTIQKQDNNKYLVLKFAPQYYVESTEK